MKGRVFGSIARMCLVALMSLGMISVVSAASLQQVKDRGFIRIAVANEIPYGYMDASGEAHGFGPDVARKVLERMGIKDIQWTVTEFGSLIPALKAGRVDLVAASQAVLPARCKQVDFSHPGTTYGEGLMVKKGNPKNIHSYEDFVKNPDLKMGIVSGADQLDFANAIGIPQDQLVMLGANTDSVSAVASGRIDAYAATYLTAERLAKKSSRVEMADPFTDPVVNGEPVRSWGAFTFAKDEDSLREAFNKNLDAVQKTAWWRKTLMGYGLDKHSIDMVHAKTTKELCTAKK